MNRQSTIGRTRGSERRVSAAQRIAAFLLLAPLSVVGCSPSGPPRNVILITLDALTAGHLGVYGYGRNTSPYIDAFAQQATRYTRAYSASTWTLPGHASLFTGKYPFEHGARTFKTGPESTSRRALAEEHRTLAEVFHDAGFRTAAFVGNTAYLSPRWNLDQGFDSYQNERLKGGEMNERVLAWLEESASAPFFLFINYMDTHSPYNTAPPSERPDWLAHVAHRRSWDIIKRLNALTNGPEPFPEEDMKQLVDLYDISIANIDEHIHALFEELRVRELYDDTLIVLTSDHGEYLGAHQIVEHNKDVYEEALWVPLIVKHAGQRRGETVDTETSLVDVPQIILASFPPELRNADFPPRTEPRPVIGESYYEWPYEEWKLRFGRIRTAIYDWPHKFIHSSDGDHELYDLSSDRDEKTNLVLRNTELAGRLRANLEAVRPLGEPDAAPDEAPELTDEEIEELKALGYL
jgi:arylsulfatase A-like enzyme